MNILLSIFSWLMGILLLAVMFPVTFVVWLVTLPFDRRRSAIHWLLVYQSVALSYLIPAWKLKITGREKINRDETYVIIANHQSLLDSILMSCIRMRFKWVSKIENYSVPFIGWYLRMADYITVDRNNDESKEVMLMKSLRCLRSGTSIMIFPEGTRSPDGRPGFFKRGAFQLAAEAKVPILPVLIDGSGDVLPKHGLVVKGRKKITITIFDPVYPESFSTDDPLELGERFRKFITEKLIAGSSE
jgi:1-acyl-sn-glycerol-3-phosphate acyltransferase